MKKDKIKYNCLTGIILIIFNISMKFLIYGNTAIWLDDMPTYPSEERLSPEIEIFKSSMYRMIPFLIINVCITIIYIRKMYDKKIYNKLEIHTGIVFFRRCLLSLNISKGASNNERIEMGSTGHRRVCQ